MNRLEIVKAQYSSFDVVKSYMKVGLYPAEEKLIDRFFEPGSSVLEIGCGAGRATISLCEKGYQVTGIDLIPEMIEAAKQQAKKNGAKVEFQVQDAVNMNFEKESFMNVFFSFNTFEQIPGKENRKKALKDIYNILKPGGIFILTTRSGLSFGRRSFGWVFICFNYLIQLIVPTYKETKLEFGDKIWHGRYHHYINPFKIRALLNNIGFQLLLFNSESNIVKDNQKVKFFTNFKSDRMFFYVLKKN